MVPIPADLQWVLKDESVAMALSLFNRHTTAEEAFVIPLSPL
jgi:hypothetical protein